VAEHTTSAFGGAGGRDGAAVTFAVVDIATAWHVQNRRDFAGFADNVRRHFGVDLPLAPNTTVTHDAVTSIWLGPRSWLLVARGISALADYAREREAINAVGGALFDVTAARVAWTVRGPRAADALAKGCPLDFHRRAFASGACAQTLYGHIGVLIVRDAGADAFTLFVARSYARDLWHLLCQSAVQYGDGKKL